MTPHRCYVADSDDPYYVVCLCVRGADHDEDEFDVPMEDEEVDDGD